MALRMSPIHTPTRPSPLVGLAADGSVRLIVTDDDSDSDDAGPQSVALPPLAGLSRGVKKAHPALATSPFMAKKPPRRHSSKRLTGGMARAPSFKHTAGVALAASAPSPVRVRSPPKSPPGISALRRATSFTSVAKRRPGMGRALLSRTPTQKDLAKDDVLLRKTSNVSERMAGVAMNQYESHTAVLAQLGEWDDSRRDLLQAQDELAVEQRRHLRLLKRMQREALAAAHKVKPPLEKIDPRRVQGTRVVEALRPVATVWRQDSLTQFWAQWRRFAAAEREEAAQLEEKAVQLQAVYRGYRTRKHKTDAEAVGVANLAAAVVTRFMRRVAQIRREELARDMEHRAVTIQRALRAQARGKQSRAELRQRIRAAVAVLGRGSVSRVLRGVGWGTYPPSSGGMGIFKDSWAFVGGAQAGVSKPKPQESSLPDVCRDSIREYLGGVASNGDCFVVARSLCVLEASGDTKGPGAYTMADLARVAKQIEAVVEAVQAVREARKKEVADKRRAARLK